jgi:nucleolar protein 56
MIQVVSFAPWHGSAHALENANAIAEGTVTDFLAATIETNLPRLKKSEKVTLGVSDKILAGNIRAAFPYIECETPETSEVAADLLRGVRMHAPKLLKELQDGDLEKAALGLGHAYSRNKVKFSINKNDNHVIQAIASLDHLDKAVNTFAMRVREWYSWHFPELLRTVSDNRTYSKVVLFVGDKTTLNEDKLHDLAALLEDDEGKAREIIENAKASMGRDISEGDLEHIKTFAERTVKLTECRDLVSSYLATKMGVVAPNLSVLVGDTIGARLISKAGSLSNLCKYPASTVQILGAEKALFRALKVITSRLWGDDANRFRRRERRPSTACCTTRHSLAGLAKRTRAASRGCSPTSAPWRPESTISLPYPPPCTAKR